MYSTIWHLENKIDVWCVGHFTYERSGYYAGCGSVDDFKVFHGNDNITDQIDKSELSELESKYVQYCLNEECA